jgi:hypothetical protein
VVSIFRNRTDDLLRYALPHSLLRQARRCGVRFRLWHRAYRLDEEDWCATSDAEIAGLTLKIKQAQAEVAEANERTAIIEKLTAWRHITPELRVSIISSLRTFSGKKFL